MTLTHIGIFSLAAILYLLLVPARARGWFLLALSVFAVFWLQPALPIRRLDFILPSATLTLAIWAWISSKKRAWQREDFAALGLVIALVVGISLTRYLIPELRPTPSRPPDIALVLMGLAGVAAFLWIYNALAAAWSRVLLVGQLLIVGLFIILKTNALATETSALFRELAGQSVDLADPSDLGWLGFSYVAFRLIHVLRDAQMGNLPEVSLREHLTFVLFFPAFTAGPIDRIERHIEDDRALKEMSAWDFSRITEGGTRIAVGGFKKFVVADTLALIALNNTNAAQADSTLGLWLLLYAYSLRLYFDFSGYSDIAIGIARLFGIKLPENFDRPYIKNNITTFWQSWHKTLSDWVRFYVFSPLSRSLLRRKPKPNPRLIVFITQMTTMLTIGLWHGITVNFFIWGAWHGLGLFAHKVWSDRTRKWYMSLKDKSRLKTAWTVAGVLITFHFVTLGWVWFSLTEFDVALDTFGALWGGR